MKILPKNFLYPFCIYVFFNFEKIFLKSTQNFNKFGEWWSVLNPGASNLLPISGVDDSKCAP